MTKSTKTPNKPTVVAHNTVTFGNQPSSPVWPLERLGVESVDELEQAQKLWSGKKTTPHSVITDPKMFVLKYAIGKASIGSMEEHKSIANITRGRVYYNTREDRDAAVLKQFMRAFDITIKETPAYANILDLRQPSVEAMNEELYFSPRLMVVDLNSNSQIWHTISLFNIKWAFTESARFDSYEVAANTSMTGAKEVYAFGDITHEYANERFSRFDPVPNPFVHKYDVNNTTYEVLDLMEWCAENTKGRYSIQARTFRKPVIWFESDEDACLAKVLL